MYRVIVDASIECSKSLSEKIDSIIKEYGVRGEDGIRLKEILKKHLEKAPETFSQKSWENFDLDLAESCNKILDDILDNIELVFKDDETLFRASAAATSMVSRLKACIKSKAEAV
jgi:hypothetical protein